MISRIITVDVNYVGLLLESTFFTSENKPLFRVSNQPELKVFSQQTILKSFAHFQLKNNSPGKKYEIIWFLEFRGR